MSRATGSERLVEPPRPESLIPTQRARRERIVDQAFEALVTQDYDDIQVRDIAERAGVALGTVYRYFASKEHLIAAALVKWGDALRQRVQRRPMAATDVSGQLHEVYLRAIDAFHRRPQVFRALMTIDTTTDPYARELWREFGRVSSEAFDEPLQSLDPQVAEKVSNTLLPVLHGLLRAWSNGSMTIDEARSRMSDAIDLIFSVPPQPAGATSLEPVAIAGT